MIVEILPKITSPWRQKNGPVVPKKFTAFVKSVARGQKLEEQLMHIKELC